ncbi:MAG: methyltransferase domain-containing protein [Gammaproteobacteria bacterium]|nr:methyltransferase domain-containing protein [Gammaproteobacteria bacterium]
MQEREVVIRVAVRAEAHQQPLEPSQRQPYGDSEGKEHCSDRVAKHAARALHQSTWIHIDDSGGVFLLLVARIGIRPILLAGGEGGYSLQSSACYRRCRGSICSAFAVSGFCRVPWAFSGCQTALPGITIERHMDDSVTMHYGGGTEGAGVADPGLPASAGKDPANLTTADLASVDEFHIRGSKATFELGEHLQLRDDAHVLDIGSGLGGPARALAQNYGCRVTGVDLAEAFCEAARELSRWVGLMTGSGSSPPTPPPFRSRTTPSTRPSPFMPR